MRKIFITFILLLVTPSARSSDDILGNYSTVSESQCNLIIKLFKNGKGKLLETCRREDGSHIDDVETQEITWSTKEEKIIITINGKVETFTFNEKLSCKSFAETGSSNGLVGYGTQFWRMPINCK